MLAKIFIAMMLLAEQRRPANSDIENIGNRDINSRQINLMSIEKEIELGRQLSAEVDRTVRIVDDRVINEYVESLTFHLAKNSDAHIPITIKVVDSDEINAFALPGFVYLNVGLIKMTENEAELASVIAHSIAHTAARHGAENASKGQLINLATIPLIFLGGTSGFSFFQQSGGTLIPVAFYQFSQGMVSEADFLGVQYLYKAGFDPEASVTVLQKAAVSGLENRPGSNRMLTHPPLSERIAKLQGNIRQILPPRNSHLVNSSGFRKVKARLGQ